MRLFMKQKVFSFGDKFTIKDQNESDRWFVEGEVFSMGKRLHILDAQGRERALLRQKVWSFLPRYFVEIDGVEVAQVVKDFTFLKPHYHLEGSPLELEGDFWAHDYRLLENGSPVMYMSKQWMTWGDSYQLDIDDRADELLCLAIALAVDCAVASEQNN